MKKLLIVLLMASLLLGAFACSSSSEKAVTTFPGVAPAPESAGQNDGYYPVPAPTVVPAATTKPASTDTTTGESWAGERMIVRSGQMSLVVVDVAETLEEIIALANAYDGYVVSSNSWQNGERLEGNIAFRVPAEKFEAAIAALRGMAVKVNSESTTGEDVTEEYVDLSSKLRNLEAAEAQLLKLMEEKTEKVTDILEVQRELTNTRAQIEQTKGRMQYLEQSAAMSLLQVSLTQSKLDVEFAASTRNIERGQEVWFSAKIAGGFAPYSYQWDFGDGNTSTEESPVHTYKSKGSYTVTLTVTDDKGNTDSYERLSYITVLPGWNAGNTFSSAWNGFLAFGRVVVNIIIWVLVFIPLWIIIGVIVYFAWWRRRKKGKQN